MSYYTSFSLTVKGKDLNWGIVDALDQWLEEHEIIGYALENGNLYKEGGKNLIAFGPYDTARWYAHEKDMLALSEAFPDLVFELHGEGENTGDLWNEYFCNGENEYCPVQILYPEPQKIKWE